MSVVTKRTLASTAYAHVLYEDQINNTISVDGVGRIADKFIISAYRVLATSIHEDLELKFESTEDPVFTPIRLSGEEKALKVNLDSGRTAIVAWKTLTDDKGRAIHKYRFLEFGKSLTDDDRNIILENRNSNIIGLDFLGNYDGVVFPGVTTPRRPMTAEQIIEKLSENFDRDDLPETGVKIENLDVKYSDVSMVMYDLDANTYNNDPSFLNEIASKFSIKYPEKFDPDKLTIGLAKSLRYGNVEKVYASLIAKKIESILQHPKFMEIVNEFIEGYDSSMDDPVEDEDRDITLYTERNVGNIVISYTEEIAFENFEKIYVLETGSDGEVINIVGYAVRDENSVEIDGNLESDQYISKFGTLSAHIPSFTTNRNELLHQIALNQYPTSGKIFEYNVKKAEISLFDRVAYKARTLFDMDYVIAQMAKLNRDLHDEDNNRDVGRNL